MKPFTPRGYLRLRKGIIANLHPKLKILDDTFIKFEGLFDLDNRFFYISYGENLEKGILTHDVNTIVMIIKEYETDTLNLRRK
jgi:hypothetical protein